MWTQDYTDLLIYYMKNNFILKNFSKLLIFLLDKNSNNYTAWELPNTSQFKIIYCYKQLLEE